MAVKVGINGFGRIGRNVLRAIVEAKRDDIEVVAVNDLAAIEDLAHMLEFDSVHGRFAAPVAIDGNALQVGGMTMAVSARRNPGELAWNTVDVALECTGLFTDRESAGKHLENGSAKVLVSAPAKDVDRTVVMGVNDADLEAGDTIVSNASCTTNCLAPVAKVLNEAIGIDQGFMTTVHAYTGNQPTLDTLGGNLYRSRAAALSMIPTTTGAARAVGLVLPELQGRLDGVALRVPVPNVSVVDLTFTAARATSVGEINAAICAAAEGPMAGILGVTGRPNVSIDFNHDSRSSVFHLDQTRVMDGTLCRILSWYDNEWGFSNRMADVAVRMHALR
ncbi:MAG: type I glyceraldehyde-3-phosphate dehydrogenase [Rhodobacteraceae bacterium]|nr:type I glyceraldehyde-3-phosphate dehydrogenase [Paracoccaceae bacterium]